MGAIPALFGAFSCLLIVLNRVIYGVILLLAGLLLLIFYQINKDPSISKSDILGFIDALIKAYAAHPMQKALQEALTSSAKLKRAISPMIHAYMLGDRNAPLRMEKFEGCPENLYVIINRALINGEDVHRELLGLQADMIAENKNKALAYSHERNASFVSMLGITFFIPVFSGISLGILTYAPSIGNLSGISISSMTLTFSAFIIIESLASIMYSSNKKFSQVFMPFCCATGLLILRAVSFLAISAI